MQDYIIVCKVENDAVCHF